MHCSSTSLIFDCMPAESGFSSSTNFSSSSLIIVSNSLTFSRVGAESSSASLSQPPQWSSLSGKRFDLPYSHLNFFLTDFVFLSNVSASEIFAFTSSSVRLVEDSIFMDCSLPVPYLWPYVDDSIRIDVEGHLNFGCTSRSRRDATRWN